jgi:hypothetical protein
MRHINVSEPCTYSVTSFQATERAHLSLGIKGLFFWLKSIVNAFLFVETCIEHSVGPSVHEFVLLFLLWFPLNRFISIGGIVMFWL